jgi:cysteinyl-tRNA synthetase
MAEVWMHNGFLQVEGEKMSKSLGNFITIRELLAEKKFGGQQWHGQVLRLAMLGTQYRQPIDWTLDRLQQTRTTLMEWARLLHGTPTDDTLHAEFLGALSDDLNTPAAFAVIHGLVASARNNAEDKRSLKSILTFLGVYNDERDADFMVGQSVDAAKVEGLIAKRNAARKAKNFAEADRLRAELSSLGVAIEDGSQGTTWKVVS